MAIRFANSSVGLLLCLESNRYSVTSINIAWRVRMCFSKSRNNRMAGGVVNFGQKLLNLPCKMGTLEAFDLIRMGAAHVKLAGQGICGRL